MAQKIRVLFSTGNNGDCWNYDIPGADSAIGRVDYKYNYLLPSSVRWRSEKHIGIQVTDKKVAGSSGSDVPGMPALGHDLSNFCSSCYVELDEATSQALIAGHRAYQAALEPNRAEVAAVWTSVGLTFTEADLDEAVLGCILEFENQSVRSAGGRWERRWSRESLLGALLKQGCDPTATAATVYHGSLVGKPGLDGVGNLLVPIFSHEATRSWNGWYRWDTATSLLVGPVAPSNGHLRTNNLIGCDSVGADVHIQRVGNTRPNPDGPGVVGEENGLFVHWSRKERERHGTRGETTKLAYTPVVYPIMGEKTVGERVVLHTLAELGIPDGITQVRLAPRNGSSTYEQQLSTEAWEELADRLESWSA